MFKRLRYSVFLLILVFAGMMSCRPGAVEHTGDHHLPNPRNVILFVGDGMGYNHVLAANYFLHGESGVQPYEQDDWVHFGLATYGAVVRIDNGDTTYSAGYNPRKAWSDPDYLPVDYTGSAESATALSTGKKTYNPSIGMGMLGDTLTHISQVAKSLGKSIGVVASVPFSHATPAGFAAHNFSRHNLWEIARYMLFDTRLDLIMGAGHPLYDDNGLPAEDPNTRFFGPVELWEQLAVNDGRVEFSIEGETYRLQDASGDGQPDPWTYIEEREDFLALASGETPSRVLGVPKVYSTLNYGRDMGDDETMPFTVPFNENVPTLEEMTQAALNVLAQNPQGFFVMIEGGAIDWAAHDNRLGRMIEEQADFNDAVRVAIEWVETHSSWDETLVIVTSDHECGYLTGPEHPQPVNPPVKNKGEGHLPSAKWNYGSHTNMLVPFYAKGSGSELYSVFADEYDPVRGPFLQNSEVPQPLFLIWGKTE